MVSGLINPRVGLARFNRPSRCFNVAVRNEIIIRMFLQMLSGSQFISQFVVLE